MNALRNKVQLIGRLGQDPEIVNFTDGNKMAKFSLATDDSYKDKNGSQRCPRSWTWRLSSTPLAAWAMSWNI